jgi:hypothetical protein
MKAEIFIIFLRNARHNLIDMVGIYANDESYSANTSSTSLLKASSSRVSELRPLLEPTDPEISVNDAPGVAFAFSCLPAHFCKALFVSFVICSEQSIPEIKIQAVVAFAVVVMHVMVR